MELKQPHHLARAKLLDRIQKGRTLASMQVDTPDQAQGFDAEYQKWNEYNETLLTALFTTDTERTNYQWSVSMAVTVGQSSPLQRYRRQLEAIQVYCRSLESLAERLELIPLASGVPSTPDQPTKSGTDAWWALLHDRVQAVARTRFENGHYADAVEAALKALNNEVKGIARARGAPDLDGAKLMHTVFSPSKPIIVLGDLSTQTGQDVQQGYMELFAGAMSGVRNPKAHDNVVISEQRAIHFLFLASVLWHTLDARVCEQPGT